MAKYFAAPGTPFSDEDAEEIGPELAALAESGASSPVEIVEYARANETPLRRHLQMDRPLDEVAESWYRNRARQMAGAILVNVQTASGRRAVRAFHSVTVATVTPAGGAIRRQYVTIQQVRDSEPLAEQVLSEALARLREFQVRYEVYREVLVKAVPALAAVFTAIDEAA